MKLKFILTALCFYLCCSQSSNAQGVVELFCRVIDAETKTPISYATIQFGDSNNGIVANIDGDFRIPFSYKQQKKTIVISSIGFKTLTLQLNNLDNKAINIIELQPKVEELDVIVLKGSNKTSTKDNKTAYSIIKTAIALLLTPYDGDKKYINNTELSGQGGNELGILNIHNPIRNFDQPSFSFIYVFEKKFLENHDLTNLKKVYLNDEVLYEISFKAIDKLTKSSHKASGKIYISKTDFAIHKLTYAVYEIKTPEPLFEVNIEYKKRGKYMYLNYITFNNQFVVTDNFKFDVTEIQYDSYEKAFYIKFNSDIKESSISKKDFKFRFKKNKLLVDSFELIDLRTIKVFIADWSIPKELLVKSIETETTEVEVRDSKSFVVKKSNTSKDSIDTSLFEYRIKNIYDITNRKIFKSPKTIGYQFREFFVQEIFEDKETTDEMIFIDKYKPLSEAKENKLRISKSYWLNSPLRGSKN